MRVKQFVWDVRYVDALLLRWYDADTNGSAVTHYAMHDAQFNITGLIAGDGSVVERYEYDAYGQRTVLDADFSDDADNTSDFDFQFGHQGLMHDAETGLIHNRNRMRHPTLGRFIQRDPLGYVDGMSVYGYIKSMVTVAVDPFGGAMMLPDPLEPPPVWPPQPEDVPPVSWEPGPVTPPTAGDYPQRPKRPVREPKFCPENTCDVWFLDITLVGGAGVYTAALTIEATLEPHWKCCMDTESRDYGYVGMGAGGGANWSISKGERRGFVTKECVRYSDHEGWGRASSLGFGVGKMVLGTMVVVTPQTYQHLGGISDGIDASAVFTIGYWDVH